MLAGSHSSAVGARGVGRHVANVAQPAGWRLPARPNDAYAAIRHDQGSSLASRSVEARHESAREIRTIYATDHVSLHELKYGFSGVASFVIPPPAAPGVMDA